MKMARFHKQSGRTQSVLEHLTNVSDFCRQNAEKINLSNTAYLIGILHDMGKLSEEFESYMESQMKGEKQSETKVDHGVYGAKYIFCRYENGDYIQKIASQIIAFVICYHHGGLSDCIGKNEIPLIKRMGKLSEENLHAVTKEFEELFSTTDLTNIFSKACEEIQSFIETISKKNIELDSFFFDIHLLIKTLYSILIDSDWLDSYLFEADIPIEEYKSSKPLENDLDLYISNLQNKIDSFKHKEPDGKMQKIVFEKRNQIANDCLEFAKNETGIYTLTVPTGGGKTLSSFCFALNHAKERGKERIFYIAPFLSIIEQNASEIRESLQCGDNLLEFHSNVVSVENEEEKEETENVKLFSARWDYHFVFTTMVQFLNTFYAAPSQDIRRLQSLANSIIIFDEVQSVPLHCISLFNSAVNFLNKCLNCTIVLCTATQPVLDEVPKPVKLSHNSEMIINVKDAFDKLKRVEVVDKTIDGGYTYEQVIEFMQEIQNTYPSILLIVNTISAAENIFNLIKEMNFEGKLFYLSSNLCPCHRKKVIEDIKNALDNEESVICISTQVIECGVDISFSTVIRSLAGIDSIAQASGRCNRHGEREISKAFIIKLKENVENTKGLLPIHFGKYKTIGILDLYKKDPQYYDNSLVSSKIVRDYFKRFISEDKVQEQFDYPLPCIEGTMYELLSKKASLINSYNAYAKGKYSLCFCFQFKTARENFAVIEKNTKTIIVPYDKGKEIIADLISAQDLKKKAFLLKQAQYYSVNIFENKFKQLQSLGAIKDCDIEGVYLLAEGFYSHDTGIALDGRLDFLCQ